MDTVSPCGFSLVPLCGSITGMGKTGMCIDPRIFFFFLQKCLNKVGTWKLRTAGHDLNDTCDLARFKKQRWKLEGFGTMSKRQESSEERKSRNRRRARRTRGWRRRRARGALPSVTPEGLLRVTQCEARSRSPLVLHGSEVISWRNVCTVLSWVCVTFELIKLWGGWNSLKF